MEKDPVVITREIAQARLQARKEWLDEHSGDDLDGYGHAHRVMAQIEQDIVDGFTPEGMSLEKFIQDVTGKIFDKYGVDVNQFPDQIPGRNMPSPGID